MLSSVPGTPTDQRTVDNANHPPEYNFHFEYVSIRYKKCPPTSRISRSLPPPAGPVESGPTSGPHRALGHLAPMWWPNRPRK